MEQPYTHRELNMKFEKLTDEITKNHEETLASIDLLDRKNHDKHLENSAKLEKIEMQTTKTNGRVSKSEEEISKLKTWRFGIVMASSVVTAVVIPLVLYIFFTQTNAINQQLQELKVEIRK